MRIARGAVLLVAALAGCSSAVNVPTGVQTGSPRATNSPTPTPTATIRATPTPAATLPASDEASGAPPAVDPGFEPGSLAAIITTDLVVRSAPGTGTDSEIQPATLSAPSIVYVIDGPVIDDGYAWYLVDPVVVSWAPSDLPHAGWIAAGGKDGEAWIGRHEGACEEHPTMEYLVALHPQLRLYCYAGQTLTVDAVAYGCGMGILGPRVRPWDRGCLLFTPGEGPDTPPPPCSGCAVPRLTVSFNDLALPPSGATISLMGHFDDPDAQDCVPSAAGEAPWLAVYQCRLEFIATSFGTP